MDIWIVSTTLATAEEALAFAGKGVEEGRAACAQVEEAITSVYQWKGELHREKEARILFKADPGNKDGLVSWILADHPYEVPEVLAWPAESGNPAYTEWVRKA